MPAVATGARAGVLVRSVYLPEVALWQGWAVLSSWHKCKL